VRPFSKDHARDLARSSAKGPSKGFVRAPFAGPFARGGTSLLKTVWKPVLGQSKKSRRPASQHRLVRAPLSGPSKKTRFEGKTGDFVDALF
jgi:hypothetical protein